MGLFRREPPPEPPLRREKVMRLMQAIMEEQDSDPDASEPVRKMHAAYQGLTQAEMRAAHEGARRHG